MSETDGGIVRAMTIYDPEAWQAFLAEIPAIKQAGLEGDALHERIEAAMAPLLEQFWNWTATFDPAGVTFGQFEDAFEARRAEILKRTPLDLEDWVRGHLRLTWEMADDRLLFNSSDMADRLIRDPGDEL